MRKLASLLFFPFLITVWIAVLIPSTKDVGKEVTILHPTFTPTPSPTASPTPTPTSTPTPSPTPSPTPTPTPTPLPTPDGVKREAVVPILLYHYISPPPPDANQIRKELSVSPQQFEEHLQYFKSQGYTTITLKQLVYYLTIGKPLPPKPLIITFDDGYRDHYTDAFPLLRKYGFVATFFVITDFIDEKRPGYLSWEQVEEMARAGMEIGAHGRNHESLKGRDLDYLVWQILGSRQTLEAHGIEPRFFSYPFGFYDDEVVKVLKSAHFWGAVITEPGVVHTSDNLFTLKRIRVNGQESLDKLIAKIKFYEPKR